MHQREEPVAQGRGDEAPKPPRVHHRVRHHIRKRRMTNFAYRVIVGVIGATVIAVGIVLLPLPGPGWLVIFAGLFILSTEFLWAQRLLHFARAKVEAWTDWVMAQSMLVRGLIGLATFLLVMGALGGYVAWQGVPEWVPVIG